MIPPRRLAHRASAPCLPKRRAALAAALAASLALLAAPAALAATPGVALAVHSVAQPTRFQPTDPSDMYTLLVENVGSRISSASEVITLTDTLPAGVTTSGEPTREGEGIIGLECPGAGPGQSVVTCTMEAPIPALTQAGKVIGIPVSVEPAATGPLINSVTVSGGGAPTSASASEETQLESPSLSPLQFEPLDFSASALNPAGELETQAAGHPSGLATTFHFTTVLGDTGPNPGEFEVASLEPIKHVVIDLPPGLVGDPQAAPTCSLSELEAATGTPGGTKAGCKPATRIGALAEFVNRSASGGEEAGGYPGQEVFNITPERGYPAEFGAYDSAYQKASLLYARLVGSGAGAHVQVVSGPLTQFIGFTGFSTIFFGDPAEKDNTGQALRAFFSNPSDCSQAGFTTKLYLDSWQHPGRFNPDGTPDLSDPNWKAATAASPPVTGCEVLQFNPSFALTPATSQADSPAGLHVDLSVPQNEQPQGLATPPLRDATVTLPKGLAVNPSSADGLAACAAAQIAVESTIPGECPAASKLGEVELETPLLSHVLHGSVYLGVPDCAPCTAADAEEGKLVKLYIEVNDPASGVVVKLPGTVAANAEGRLTATFAENPQLPFSDLKLNFKAGPRATLTTPPTCGHYTTETDLKPWSAPHSGPDATPSSGFDVSSGPNGSPCAPTEAAEPNHPGFEAGTTTPIAGSYSPFVLKLRREPGSQVLKALDTTLPPGLTGRLAGIPYCPQADLEAAQRSSGAVEKASPSCPLASQVGTVNVGAGSGTPYYVQGHAYLAGPYKGAPLSLAIVTPAVAGPFDLGTVVVRAALYVNPETAQIHAVSDPIPTILAGIPLDVRSIALNMDRNQFTLNPTSCNPMAVTGNALSVLDQSASLSDRFQVGACKALDFTPKLGLRLFGKTHRGAHPRFRAVLTMKPGEANIARAAVSLPHSEFLDQGHIKTICTRVVFAEGAVPGEKCPAGSIYGHARAITPLLDQPLEGPVYLRSSSHELPDLVAALNGQIQIALDGRIDSVHGGIRNTFEAVPDAPVSRFVLNMQGGRKGLLVNSTNLCKTTNRAVVKLNAQNGKVHDFNPVVRNSCKKRNSKRHHSRASLRHLSKVR